MKFPLVEGRPPGYGRVTHSPGTPWLRCLKAGHRQGVGRDVHQRAHGGGAAEVGRGGREDGLSYFQVLSKSFGFVVRKLTFRQQHADS